MREILFRGKRIDSGEWVYGCYLKHDLTKVCFSSDDPKTKHMIVKDGACDWGFEPEMRAYDVIPESVSEYTGIKDKNSRRIFEGDIFLHDNKDLYEVAWCDERKFFCAMATDLSDDDYLGNFYECNMEVIGNIHDNPELIAEVEV